MGTLRATRINRWKQALSPRTSWDVNQEGAKYVLRAEPKMLTCKRTLKKLY